MLRYERDGAHFAGVGVGIWPSALRTEETPRNRFYHRRSWELMLEVGHLEPVTSSIRVGAYFGLTFGRRWTEAGTSDGQVDMTAGAELRWRLGPEGAWSLRYRLGFSTLSRNKPTIYNFELSVLSALGLAFIFV
jgi:hypothetical protein